MSFTIPTPFGDWEEPFYTFIKVREKKIFLAHDENVFMWADATDPTAQNIIIDLIENSIWTPYAIMALCEDERIIYGIIYIKYILEGV